eukprot:11494126-Alexandrium_andersonii.AAC.1
MSASLVGSEMCIRDSPRGATSGTAEPNAWLSSCFSLLCAVSCAPVGPVSYTHLTLPTICSV